MRKTKILATLGPASHDKETIKSLILNGLDAARINFSHGTYESHSALINEFKAAREELGRQIPLILDTKGPEIRIKTFSEEQVYLKQGEDFTLTTEDIVGDVTKVAVTYKELPNDLKVGSRVLIDDGLVELKVKELTDTDIHCTIINSGFLSSRKGVNVPDVYVNLPSLTENDIRDIEFGVKMGFDYIAASFIRSANDIVKIRQVLSDLDADYMRIIAKIESRDGVNNLDSILELADGIMVARGDLGVEIPPEEVPLVQKLLIKKANLAGKPVVTATQMLESMVKNPRPTRAEANDVANAIFDGSDVIMLSGETANGKYPVEAVKMMARIAIKTEESIDYYNEITNHTGSFISNITNAISYAAYTTAADLNAACIVTLTDSGFTARSVSKFRPPCPILAVTPNERVCRQLGLTWGCIPVLSETIIHGTDEVFDNAEKIAFEQKLVKNGDIIVTVAGVPVGIAGTTNTLKVRIAGDVLTKGKGFGGALVKGNAQVIKVVEQANRFFDRNDIIIASKTTDEMIPFIRKAAALVVGSWDKSDNAHALTVSKSLNIPLIISDQGVVDLIPNGAPITVDSMNGIVYNGYKE